VKQCGCFCLVIFCLVIVSLSAEQSALGQVYDLSEMRQRAIRACVTHGGDRVRGGAVSNTLDTNSIIVLLCKQTVNIIVLLCKQTVNIIVLLYKQTVNTAKYVLFSV